MKLIIPYYGSSTREKRCFARTMSDGSVEIVALDAKRGKPVRIDKFPKDVVVKDENYANLPFHRAESTYFEKDYTLFVKGNKLTWIYKNPESIVTKRIETVTEDEFGTKIVTDRRIFNKNLRLSMKRADLKRLENGPYTEGTLTMRNGDKYVVKFAEDGRSIETATKICKNGTKCESDLSNSVLFNQLFS